MRQYAAYIYCHHYLETLQNWKLSLPIVLTVSLSGCVPSFNSVERLNAAEMRAVRFPISAVLVDDAAKGPVEQENISFAAGLLNVPILKVEKLVQHSHLPKRGNTQQI